jgi:hypothetical protein
MSGAAGGDAGGQPVSLSRAEQKGTVVIYSPYINKLKTIQEVRTPDGMRTLRALSPSLPPSLPAFNLAQEKTGSLSFDRALVTFEVRDVGTDMFSLHPPSTCRAGASRRTCASRIQPLGRFSR